MYLGFWRTVKADLYRLEGNASFWTGFVHGFTIFGNPGFRCVFWYRVAHHLYIQTGWKRRYGRPLRFFVGAIYNYMQHRYGIELPREADIGPGLQINHFGGIFVYPFSTIGKNCNISQGVTIGVANRGKCKGYPSLGDKVYVGPGAITYGAVHIGDGAMIGANAVIYEDIPPNAIVVASHYATISQAGSDGYCNRTDWEGKI